MISRILKLVVMGVVLSVVLMMVLALVMASREPTTDRPRTTTAVAQPEPEKLTVVDWKFKRAQYGNVVIVGTVKNNTSKQYSYAQIQFNLYDKAGNQVGSTLANVNNLEPNGAWKFEAVVLQPEGVDSAKVTAITGF